MLALKKVKDLTIHTLKLVLTLSKLSDSGLKRYFTFAMTVFVFDYVTFIIDGGKSNRKYYLIKIFDEKDKKLHELTLFNNKHIKLLKNY